MNDEASSIDVRSLLEGCSLEEVSRRSLILADIERNLAEHGLRQPLNEPARASQFLPFAALVGFEEALERVCAEQGVRN